MPTWCSAISIRHSSWAARCGSTPSRAPARSSQALRERSACALARAAWGIHEIVNEDVARAFRVHAAERGFDYRGCSMVAFGGSRADPRHADRAQAAAYREVIFPAGAGVMSAFGLLVEPAEPRDRTVRPRVRSTSSMPSGFAAQVRGSDRRGDVIPVRGGDRCRRVEHVRRLDMRYLGQGYEIEVALPNDARHQRASKGCRRCSRRATRESSR